MPMPGHSRSSRAIASLAASLSPRYEPVSTVEAASPATGHPNGE